MLGIVTNVPDRTHPNICLNLHHWFVVIVVVVLVVVCFVCLFLTMKTHAGVNEYLTHPFDPHSWSEEVRLCWEPRGVMNLV